MKDKKRRDVELILLGVVLGNGPDRERVLNSLPRGSFTKELEFAINAVRDQKRDAVLDWLNQKDITVSNGMDFIDTLIDEVDADNRQQTVRDVCKQLGFASRIESVSELTKRLEKAIETLRGISDVR